MPHVQGARNIRWWHGDHKGVSQRFFIRPSLYSPTFCSQGINHFGLEEPSALPPAQQQYYYLFVHWKDLIPLPSHLHSSRIIIYLFIGSKEFPFPPACTAAELLVHGSLEAKCFSSAQEKLCADSNIPSPCIDLLLRGKIKCLGQGLCQERLFDAAAVSGHVSLCLSSCQPHIDRCS